MNNGLIFRWTCRGVGILPRRVSYLIGDVGTWIAWKVMAGTREAIADNLRALFPEESPRQLARRARQTLRAYARDTVDFLRALDATPEEASALFAYPEEAVETFRTLMARHRGVILASGHYGNWELGGVAMNRVFKLPLTVVAMAEADEDVNRIRRDIRTRLGVNTIEVRRALDTALQIRKTLADNGMVALLMDRHMGRDRVPVTFLGRQAWFLRTPAQMAHLTGAAIVPCFIERQKNGRFTIQPGSPILVDSTLPREQAFAEATQRFADQLEARVRQHPEYWYQFYRYWDAQLDAYDKLL